MPSPSSASSPLTLLDALDALKKETLGLSGASLSACPSPLAVFDGRGELCGANGRAEVLLDILASEAASRVKVAVRRAAETQTALVEQVEARTDAGAMAVELTLLPEGGGADMRPLPERRVLALVKDVTMDRNLRLALVDSRQRYKDLVDISHDFAWETGEEGTFTFVSPKGAFGYRAEDLIHRSPDEFLVSRSAMGAENPFSATQVMEKVEVWLLGSDGQPVCMAATASPLYGPEGEWRGARGVCRDITALREQDAALARARTRERLLTFIVRTVRDEPDPLAALGMAVEVMARGLGADGCEIYGLMSPSGGAGSENFVRMRVFGDSGPAGLQSTALRGLLTGSEMMESSGDGWRFLASSASNGTNAAGALLLWRREDSGPWTDDDRIMIADLSAQMAAVIELVRQADLLALAGKMDPVTGLLGQEPFLSDVTRRMARLQQDGEPGALVICAQARDFEDEDAQELGSSQEEKIRRESINALADMIVAGVRPSDIVARTDHGFFAIWLDKAAEHAVGVRTQALMAAAQRLELGGLWFGAAVWMPEMETSASALLQAAVKAATEAQGAVPGSLSMSPLSDETATMTSMGETS